MCSWKALGCTQFFSVKQNIPSPPPSLCERFFVRVYPNTHKGDMKMKRGTKYFLIGVLLIIIVVVFIYFLPYIDNIVIG